MNYPLESKTLIAALDTIEEAIAIYDADDRLIAFNEHYAAWRTAIGGDVAPGVCWADLVQASVRCGAIPEAIGREEQWLEQRRQARGSYSIIRRLADGRAFKVNERRMADGGIAVVWTDISDLDKAERERTLAQISDEQHLHTMGHLAANVAHDFNNVLTAIVGNLGLLREHLSPDDARARRLLNNAELGAERGAALVGRLLAFSRRKPAPAPRSVDLAGLIRGMLDLLRTALSARVRLTVAVEATLAPVCVDPSQLELALLNLAVNARDAMDGDGEITIAAREESGASGTLDSTQVYVVVSVTDTGSGMNEATLARATEPLFTTKAVGKGTGLGLSMVHSLAARSGGRFVLHSTLGMGTTAEIWLPRATTLPGDPVPPSPEGSR